MHHAFLQPRWRFQVEPQTDLYGSTLLRIYTEPCRFWRWCRKCGVREWMDVPGHPFIKEWNDERLRDRELLEQGFDIIMRRNRAAEGTVTEALER